MLSWLPIAAFLLVPVSILILWRSRGWRPKDRPTPWRLGPGPSLALFGVSFVAGAIAAGLVPALLPPDADVSPTLRVAIGTWAALLGGLLGAAPGLALWWSETPEEGAEPPLPVGPGLRFGALGLLVALPLVQAAAVLGQAAQQAISGREPEVIAHETLQLLTDSPLDLGWWLMAAGAVIGAPLLEEILYRGFLQQACRRLGVGPWLATLGVSGIFVLMHLPALPDDGRMSALAGLLVLSIALGTIRERTGRLDACVLAHALFNGFNLLLASATTT